MLEWNYKSLNGWGRLSHIQALAAEITNSTQACEAILSTQSDNIIAYGMGRSYGDIALNSTGRTLLTTNFSHFKELDVETGHLTCDPGVTFHDLAQEYLSSGFFVPVTPGTAYVTIGGAIANDIHGKNHDIAGSFGQHVLWLDLLLPQGDIIRASREQMPELFDATIGGLGLTGIILKVCFKMQRIPGNSFLVREEKIINLEHFFEAFKQARSTSTYSVGWIDALAKGGRLGRGIFETAELSSVKLPKGPKQKLRIPFNFPNFALNGLSIRLFNKVYYNRISTGGRKRHIHINNFLYPLDSILEWNRIYGKRGFYQFQCVIPEQYGYEGIKALLETIANSGSGSFLAVLKTLGNQGNGYLSFPLKGYTLALDFPNTKHVLALLHKLEQITLQYNGRIYLAKDACLSQRGFAEMYPKLTEFRHILDTIDPQHRMNSDLARRLKIRSNN